MSTTVEIKIHLARADKGRVVLREGAPPLPSPNGRVPRVARLMALAIRIERLIREGSVRDYADFALSYAGIACLTTIRMVHAARNTSPPATAPSATRRGPGG